MSHSNRLSTSSTSTCSSSASAASHLLTPISEDVEPRFNAILWRRNSEDADGLPGLANGLDVSAWEGLPDPDGLEAKIGSILNLTPRLSACLALPSSPIGSLSDTDVQPDDSPLLPCSSPRMQAACIPHLELPTRYSPSMAVAQPAEASARTVAVGSSRTEAATRTAAAPAASWKGKGRAMDECMMSQAYESESVIPSSILPHLSISAFPSRLSSSSSTSSGSTSSSTSASANRRRGPPCIPLRLSSRPRLVPPPRASSLRFRRSSTSNQSVVSVVSDHSDILAPAGLATTIEYPTYPPLTRGVNQTAPAESQHIELDLATRDHRGPHLYRTRSDPTPRRSLRSSTPVQTQDDTMSVRASFSESSGLSVATLRARFTSISSSTSTPSIAEKREAPASPLKIHTRPTLRSLTDFWGGDKGSSARGIMHFAETTSSSDMNAEIVEKPTYEDYLRRVPRLELRHEMVADILSEVEEQDWRDEMRRADKQEAVDAWNEAKTWAWPLPPTHMPVRRPRVAIKLLVSVDESAVSMSPSPSPLVSDSKSLNTANTSTTATTATLPLPLSGLGFKRDSLRSLATTDSLSSIASDGRDAAALLTPSSSFRTQQDDVTIIALADPTTPTAGRSLLPEMEMEDDDLLGVQSVMADDVTPKAPSRAVNEKLYVPAQTQAMGWRVQGQDKGQGQKEEPGVKKTEPLNVVKKQSMLTSRPIDENQAQTLKQNQSQARESEKERKKRGVWNASLGFAYF